jgi:GNAT superfamily N-acetyltransferase
MRGWLLQAGFSPRLQWTRCPSLVRASLEPPPFRTDLAIREAKGSDLAAAHDAVGDTMWGEYERSFGKAGFSHFMAFDDERPVAIGALATFEGIGYLNAATTAEGDRKRGAQSALIAARIAKARELGCTMLAVETLTMLEHALRNLERAGFRVAYEKEVYEWKAESPASSWSISRLRRVSLRSFPRKRESSLELDWVPAFRLRAQRFGGLEPAVGGGSRGRAEENESTQP